MRAVPFILAAFAVACTRETETKTATTETASETVAASDSTEQPSPTAAAIPALEPLWIAEGLDAPEGVAKSPDGAYFISNVAGDAGAKDGVGWISKISAEGTVINERFVDGLDAPKGLAVLNGTLYVSDIDQVRTFDAATGAPGGAISIAGAAFLNDLTAWQGEIYVADSEKANIWRLSSEGPALWREGEELRGVNGLLGDGDRLLINTMSAGDLFEATANGGWTKIATGIIDADGIGIIPESAGGGYLVSSWPGEIWHVAPDGVVTSVLNTRDAGILQNDITMFGDILIAPNWMPGTVTAWRVAAPN